MLWPARGAGTRTTPNLLAADGRFSHVALVRSRIGRKRALLRLLDSATPQRSTARIGHRCSSAYAHHSIELGDDPVDVTARGVPVEPGRINPQRSR